MIAFSLDNLLFFLLIAVAALFQLLSKTISKATKAIRTKHRAHRSHKHLDQFNVRHGNPTQIGFVNSSKHWVSRQAQLRLRLFASHRYSASTAGACPTASA